jgi:hypothetical protein
MKTQLALTAFLAMVLLPTLGFLGTVHADPKQDLVQAFKKMDSSYPIRVTEKTTGGMKGQPPQTTDRMTESATMHDYHTKWHSPSSSGEIISVGGKTYELNNGKWQITSSNPPDSESQVKIAQLVENSVQDVKPPVDETVNGVKMRAYSFRIVKEGVSGTGKAWIGITDGLPHASQLSLDMQDISMTANLAYDYDSSIKIKVPTQ